MTGLYWLYRFYGMPRFAVLDHDHPQPHLDLLLEVGDRLWAWRLPGLPGPGMPVAAERIADHRPLYLTYEGPVGGGRGTVRRVDGGDCEWKEQGACRCVVELAGDRLRGELELMRLDGDRWAARLTGRRGG